MFSTRNACNVGSRMLIQTAIVIDRNHDSDASQKRLVVHCLLFRACTQAGNVQNCLPVCALGA